jgi:RNAse (barnase) inhibitor barstar
MATQMKNEQWIAMAEEHSDFLARIRAELMMKADYGENLAKALWSITHIAGTNCL